MVRPRKQQKPQRASGSGFVENALQKLEEEQENRKTMVKKPKQQPKKGKKKVVQNIDGKGKEEDERLAPTLKGKRVHFYFTEDQEGSHGKKREQQGNKKKTEVSEVNTEDEEEKGDDNGEEEEGKSEEMEENSTKKKELSKFSESLLCHQCQRNDKGRVVKCTKCLRRRYCIPCITRWYPKMSEEEIAARCPVCRDNCNCKACLRKDRRFYLHNAEKLRYRPRSDDEKLQHSKYLLQTLLPFLKQFSQEQTMEKMMEARIQGLSYDFKFLANQYLPGAIF